MLFAAGLSLITVACGSGVSTEEYNKAAAEASQAQEGLNKAEAEMQSLEAKLESMQTELDEKTDAMESLSEEYSQYKESMAEYEGLAAAEAESRKIEAEALAESKAKAEEESRAAEQAEREAREKAGYETGITYTELARNPDDYKGQKVKFKGEVLQVMEGDKENQIRLAVQKNKYGWYDTDKVLYCGYDPSLITFRILEKDVVTIYGTAVGLFSYEAVSGATITLPAVLIDKIELEK